MQTHSDEPTSPHPRRYRWLTWLSALGLVVAGVVVGVRLWWGDIAQRRLDAAIDAAHARGERIVLADYQVPSTLPDEQNAAFYLRRAARGLKLSTRQGWAIDVNALPLREDIFQITTDALRQHELALADIRTARDLARAEWSLGIRSPMWSVLLPDLNPARRLASLSRAAALHAAQRGEHAAALEYIHDLRGISRAIDQQPFLISHLVGNGIEAHGIAALRHIVPQLSIDAPARSAATGAQVRGLINGLLNDAPRRAAIARSLQSERAAQLDVAEMVGSRAVVIRPGVRLDALRLVDEGDALLAAANAPNWPAARRLVPAPRPVKGPRQLSRLVSETVRPALGRALLNEARLTAEQRLAAAALAIRLYQRDHGGRRPATLDALVPDYLPAVPLDPLAAGAQPIRYVPDAEFPYIYSVGENGRDDGADDGWRPDETAADVHRAPDLFFHLDPPPGEPDIDDPPDDQ